MGGGQTKVYTPGSGDDESLPSKDANETPLIRLVNLAHYLDHHVPADNVKCREALAEIMDVIKTYRDGMGLDGSSDVLSAIRGNKDFEGDDHVMSLVKQIATPAVNDNARVLSGSLSRTRTIFKGNALSTRSSSSGKINSKRRCILPMEPRFRFSFSKCRDHTRLLE